MSFFGTVSHMTSTYRYNLSLRRGHNTFSKLKAQLKNKIDYHKKGHRANIDPEVLKRIRGELRLELIKERKKKILIQSLTVVFSLAMAILLYNVISLPVPTILDKDRVKAQKERLSGKKKHDSENFLFAIKEGQKWLDENKFHNAIYLFNMAKELRPNDKGANVWLLKAFLKQCMYVSIDCTKADRMHQKILIKFKTDKALRSEIDNYLIALNKEALDIH